MTAARQYMQVKRVSRRDLFLLSRIDLFDGKPFRPGNVVAACRVCRRISKRENWIAENNTCPFCGSAQTLPFGASKDLTRGAQPPVAYSVRRVKFPVSGKVMRIAGIAVVLALLILIGVNIARPPRESGFRITSEGRVYYLQFYGHRFEEGSYSINGTVYRFEKGYLVGQTRFTSDGREYVTDENGIVKNGWSVSEGMIVYQGKNGLEPNRVPEGRIPGFVDLEGLGRVFVAGTGLPGQGWVRYEGRLYHFLDGRGDPVPDLRGTFDEDGCFTPFAEGLLETEKGIYYLNGSGEAQCGFVAVDGFVYLFDENTYRRKAISSGETQGIASGASGALIPESDRIFACQSGSVIVRALTGEIRTGWIVLDGAVYKTDENGWLLSGCSWDSPEGAFDANGRFLPAQPGRLDTQDGTCFILPDGHVATGCRRERDFLCLYDEEGRLQTNAPVSGVGATDAMGAVRPYASGIYEILGDYYCLSANGTLLTGWRQSGRLYYFDPDTGKRASGVIVSDGAACALSAEGYYIPGTDGVFSVGGDTYYVFRDGTLATGWRSVDGRMMYFDEQTGKRRETDLGNETGWISRSDSLFYVFPDGTTAHGWQIIDGKVYCFDPDSGAAASGTVSDGGTVYRFREDGVLMPEIPQSVIINGVSYRVGTEGKTEGGALYRGGRLYWYGEDGTLSARPPEGFKGWVSALGEYLIPSSEGTVSLGGDLYYLTGAGDVLTGWFERGRRLYYADKATGKLAGDGERMGLDGTFREGVFIPDRDGVFTVDGNQYMLADGMLTEGWVLLDDGVGHFISGLGQVRGRSVEIDGISCAFDFEGRYVPGENTVIEVGGAWVFLDASGQFAHEEGLYPLPEGRLTAVDRTSRCSVSVLQAMHAPDTLRLVDGRIIPASSGPVALGGDWYYLDTEGRCGTGLRLVDAKLRMFSENDGKMLRNVNGFNEEGVYIPKHTGINGIRYHDTELKYWFLNTSGDVGTGMIPNGQGDTVFADDEGVLQTGLVDWNGKRYYFYNSSMNYTMAKNTLMTCRIGNEDHVIALGEDGAMVTGWYELEGALHYFDENGYMLVDTVVDGRYLNIYGDAR